MNYGRKVILERDRMKNTKVRDSYNSIVELACDDDQRFFEDHPGRDWYIRPILKGEFGQAEPADANFVYVEQIVPGVRKRIPFKADKKPGHDSKVE
jgi:hypothetical protein